MPAEVYGKHDQGTGGITTEEVGHEDIRPIETFMAGDEVFVMSDESLDDTTENDETLTRIWWRAAVTSAD